MFLVTPKGIVFQDDILYLHSEMKILKNNPGFDYQTIHNAKKIFDAEVVQFEK